MPGSIQHSGLWRAFGLAPNSVDLIVMSDYRPADPQALHQKRRRGLLVRGPHGAPADADGPINVSRCDS
jgi:hypothetical protein